MGPFYFLKNLQFSDIFRGYRSVTLTKNGLNFVARNFQVRRELKLSTYKKQLWIQSIYFF